jgi:uncharacterized heparinase superfamily protein
MAWARRSLSALAARLGAAARAAGDRAAARRAALRARPAGIAATLPEPLEIGDAETAARLAGGSAVFGGDTVAIGPQGPWAAAAPGEGWREAMHGFDWLEHAPAAARADRARLALWAADWARLFGGGAGPGWTPALAGRRLARLACVLPDLLPALDAAGQRRLLRTADAHLRFLAARLSATPDPLDRLDAAAGLALGALALRGDAGAAAAARAALGETGAAFADEGGPAAARDADRAGRAFCGLAWTAAAMAAAGLAPDPRHAAALAALGPALRALRLGDGAGPRWHGAGAGPPPPLDAAFAAAGAVARGPRRDGAFGAQRLAAGRLTALIDAAPPPASGRAGASTLAVEVSAGRTRLFGSVGPGACFGPDWDDAAREAGAFSGVEVGEASFLRLPPHDAASRALGRAPLRGPRRVACDRAEDDAALWLAAEHDGYLDRFGVVVSRRLRLSRDGSDLRGEDRVAAPTPEARARFARAARDGGLAVAARFHLPPDLPAALEGDAVRLSPEDAPAWAFRAAGARLTLEDGAWLDPQAGRVRRTRVIVAATAAAADGAGARVVWGLRRIDLAPAARATAERGASAAP